MHLNFLTTQHTQHMNPNFFEKLMLVVIGSLAGILSAGVKIKWEAFANKLGNAQKSALAFDQAVGEEGAALAVADGLMELVGEFVKGDVTDEQKERLNSIAGKIVSLPDANAEEKLETFFHDLVEVKDAGAELVAAQNAPPAEEV